MAPEISLMKRIGIVGCGAMGSKIASVIAKDFKGKAVLSALYDIAPDKASQLARRLKKKGLVVSSLGALIKRVDFVIESAHPKSSMQIALEAVRNRRDCMVMSVGGLLNAKRLFHLAKKNKARIYIPSGAICGIDGLKAHSLAGIEKVVITTRKGPSSLKGAPYITKNKIKHIF